MRRDLRRQTFSKPGKPDGEEIKKLTSDDTENPTSSPVREKNIEKMVSKSGGNTSITKKNGSSADAESDKEAETVTSEKTNPFLLSRGQASEISIEKTGYRLRSDYMDLLKLVKRMKKGYTLEAVLDDALTFYFENSEDGRKVVKQRQLLDSD